MKPGFLFNVGVAVCGFFIQLALIGDVAASLPELKNDSLPATDRQETLLTIPKFGRYSIISKSEQGTALRYINKMSGPSPVSGSAGESDGRINAFLDIGDYKICHLRG